MAEIFGTAAAAVQIAGLCGSAILASDRLHRMLQNAPAKVQRRASSIKELRNLVSSLQSDLQSNWASVITNALSAEAINRVIDLLREIEGEISALDTLLQQLLPRSKDELLERHKQKIKAIRSENDISDRFQQLQALQQYLASWYNHQILLLCGQLLWVFQT